MNFFPVALRIILESAFSAIKLILNKGIIKHDKNKLFPDVSGKERPNVTANTLQIKKICLYRYFEN